MSIAIRVQNLSKCYSIYKTPSDRLKQRVPPRPQRPVSQSPKQYRQFWPLKDVSFEIKKVKPWASSEIVVQSRSIQLGA